MQTLEIKLDKKTEQKCKKCGDCCNFKLHEFVYSGDPMHESFIIDRQRLQCGFVNDEQFRTGLMDGLNKKYGRPYFFIEPSNSHEERLKKIIKFSMLVKKKQCFFYFQGCLIHKYKPYVCQKYHCPRTRYS